jgi:hypothetical protein
MVMAHSLVPFEAHIEVVTFVRNRDQVGLALDTWLDAALMVHPQTSFWAANRRAAQIDMKQRSGVHGSEECMQLLGHIVSLPSWSRHR